MCAHAVRVAMLEIEGVQSAEVSLNRGLVTLRFRPDNRVAIGAIRRAIRENGFTPKNAQVTVAGTLVDQEGRPALRVPGQGVAFLLVAGPSAPGRAGEVARLAPGRAVVVEGSVPATREDAPGPLTLEVSSVRPGDASPGANGTR